MAILQAEPDLTEQIKWNAPSFGRDGVDRITFNLRPTDRVQLIFHRGSKAVHDLVPFRFHDSNGLLEKITEERGQVVFRDVSAFQAEKESLLALVHDWIAA